MRILTRLLAFVPLSIHVAYVLATFSHLPARLGRTLDASGTPVTWSLAAWLALVVISNVIFVFLYIKMPKFKNDYLGLPGFQVSLSDPSVREDVVSRLRSVAEISLFSLNIFFLAAYQAAYQANVPRPVVQFPRVVIFVGFMVLPLLVCVFQVGLTVSHFKRRAAPSADKCK